MNGLSGALSLCKVLFYAGYLQNRYGLASRENRIIIVTNCIPLKHTQMFYESYSITILYNITSNTEYSMKLLKH